MDFVWFLEFLESESSKIKFIFGIFWCFFSVVNQPNLHVENSIGFIIMSNTIQQCQYSKWTKSWILLLARVFMILCAIKCVALDLETILKDKPIKFTCNLQVTMSLPGILTFCSYTSTIVFLNRGMENRSGWCRGCSGQMEDVVM